MIKVGLTGYGNTGAVVTVPEPANCPPDSPTCGDRPLNLIRQDLNTCPATAHA